MKRNNRIKEETEEDTLLSTTASLPNKIKKGKINHTEIPDVSEDELLSPKASNKGKTNHTAIPVVSEEELLSPKTFKKGSTKQGNTKQDSTNQPRTSSTSQGLLHMEETYHPAIPDISEVLLTTKIAKKGSTKQSKTKQDSTNQHRSSSTFQGLINMETEVCTPVPHGTDPTAPANSTPSKGSTKQSSTKQGSTNQHRTSSSLQGLLNMDTEESTRVTHGTDLTALANSTQIKAAPGHPVGLVDVQEFSFLYIYKADMKEVTVEERKSLQEKLFRAQMETDEEIDIVKSRYLPSRCSYQIVTRGSDSLLTKLLQSSLQHPFGFWNPALTQQKDNVYIVTLVPPMSTFYLQGRLMRVIQVSIRECPIPTADHIRLAGPPRRNDTDSKVTLTLEISPVLSTILEKRTPPFTCFNLGGQIRFTRACDIAQREELNAQMSLLSVDLTAQDQ